MLHIITRLIIGGAQENTLFTVEGLSQHGYEVTLASGPALGPEGSLIRRAQESNIDFVIVPQMRREINPYFDTLTFFKLYWLIKKGQYEIVHTHSSKAGILGRLAAKLAGTEVIVHTIHGLPFHKYQGRLLNFFYIFLEKWVAQFTDRLITVSDAMKKQSLAVNLAPANKFVTIYSGMEIEKFISSKVNVEELRLKLGLPPEVPVVGKIARLSPLKGHEYLIEAAQQVIKKIPQARFLLVGDGILKKKIINMIEKAGLRKNFVFTGIISPEEIPEVIQAMDVLVHTSLREGLARALPQALASAKPVISFDLDGAREVVIDGQTGYLIRPEDADGLAEKIIYLLSNPQLARRMGLVGQQLVRDKFGVEKMVSEIEKVYQELCGI